MGPASVDCLDLPFHCTALHADSAGVFLTRNPSGALPFSLTLRIQGIRFLATTRKSPTSRTREEQLAVDRDAETLNR